MKTIELHITNADQRRMDRIRELRSTNAFTPTDEEIIRTALVTYWVAAEKREEITGGPMHIEM